jgi:hypothetical protein
LADFYHRDKVGEDIGALLQGVLILWLGDFGISIRYYGDKDIEEIDVRYESCKQEVDPD